MCPMTARSYITQRVRRSVFEIDATAHSALGLGDPSLQLNVDITFQRRSYRYIRPHPAARRCSAIYRRALAGGAVNSRCFASPLLNVTCRLINQKFRCLLAGLARTIPRHCHHQWYNLKHVAKGQIC
jgi:hypothetical protein